MFKKIFGIKDYVVGEGESAVTVTTLSIPALLARFSWLGAGMLIGAKTQILATNKVFGFKDARLVK